MSLMMPSLTALLIICFGAICYSDFRWLTIPNTINVLLLAGGLAAQITAGWTAVAMAFGSSIAVVSLMWTVRYVHLRLTGRIGLGLGDVQLAGAAAAWFSVWMFPFFLFVASSLALLFVLLLSVRTGRLPKGRIPFGPFLAASLIVTWNIEPFLDPLLGSAL